MDLETLGAVLPDPAATPEEVRAWAVANKVTVFRCNPTEEPPEPPPPPRVPRGRDVDLLVAKMPLPTKPPGRK